LAKTTRWPIEDAAGVQPPQLPSALEIGAGLLRQEAADLGDSSVDDVLIATMAVER
jgi:hypothetical protein